jgi:DNA-binding winged helix-turn-helix (wHTH) protein
MGPEKMSAVYRFDDIEVDPASARVLASGRAIALEPKAFKILIFLLESRGRLVEKRELLETVWSDTFVTENALTRAIAQLRKALGDDAREARYIETVPTLGYRFIASVETLSRPATEPAQTGRTRHFRSYWGWAVGAAVVGIGFGLAWRRPPRSAYPEPPNHGLPRQVTASMGLDAYPAPSPDGSSIAFCSDRTGAFEIYVKQNAAGRPRPAIDVRRSPERPARLVSRRTLHRLSLDEPRRHLGRAFSGRREPAAGFLRVEASLVAHRCADRVSVGGAGRSLAGGP